MIEDENKPKNDECYTPAQYIQRVRDVLEVIDLDPCSCVEAQEVVGATRFYTCRDDALNAPEWKGRVWMNPPFSRGLIREFCNRLINDYFTGDVTEAVALTNARPGSMWFQSLSAIAWRCEKRKRIKFWGPSTTGRHGFSDNVFWYLGPNPERFVAVFGELGTIIKPAIPRMGNMVGNVTLGVTVCALCKRSLAGIRRDARYCSHACRQRAYRVRFSARTGTDTR